MNVSVAEERFKIDERSRIRRLTLRLFTDRALYLGSHHFPGRKRSIREISDEKPVFLSQYLLPYNHLSGSVHRENILANCHRRTINLIAETSRCQATLLPLDLEDLTGEVTGENDSHTR